MPPPALLQRGGRGCHPCPPMPTPCIKSLSIQSHKRDQIWAWYICLALVEPFCPWLLLCFALRRAAAGWQSPARAGIPAMPAMPCPPLCPQRVRSPSKQEAGISQTRGAPSPDCQEGSAAGAAAAHGPIPPCSQPSRGSLWGDSRVLSSSGPPLSGRVLPHFFAGSWVFIIY